MSLSGRHPAFVLAFAIVASCISACGGGGGGGDASGNGGPPPSLAALFPIDGVVDFTALKDVQSLDVDYFDAAAPGAPVKSTKLTWAITNDDRDVYIAAEWGDPTYDHTFDLVNGPTDYDGIKLLIDNDGNGTHDTGEDERTIYAASISSGYIDQHVSGADETDSIGDGFGRLAYDPVTHKYQAEFLFPKIADANGEDATLTAASRYNIVLLDHVQPAGPSGNIGGAYGIATGPGADASAWAPFPLIDDGAHDHATMPAGLTGLIAFVSDHQNPKGDLYTFDPATGVVTRVTNDPTLFKDNVSLSHDRTRLAFHGAPSKTDYSNYEIYTIGVDGLGLTKLTNNVILDGHPAWSHDDSKIAYASYRDLGSASIIAMTSAGIELADLTPPGMDENDPDWLPDGRIVLKTNAFTTYPMTQIARRDADGSNLTQITTGTGQSDHDPVGNSSVVVFERFPKSTNYANDAEAGFTHWDIVQAKISDGSETILVNDGWINWLPVFDPTGQYLVHLKSVGYTDAHLITKLGDDRGRLIPAITKIRYIDWK